MIFDFKPTDEDCIVNVTDIQTRRLWEYLNEQDRQYVVVNVPVTYPVTEDGMVIPGYLGSSGRIYGTKQTKSS